MSFLSSSGPSAKTTPSRNQTPSCVAVHRQFDCPGRTAAYAPMSPGNPGIVACDGVLAVVPAIFVSRLFCCPCLSAWRGRPRCSRRDRSRLGRIRNRCRFGIPHPRTHRVLSPCCGTRRQVPPFSPPLLRTRASSRYPDPSARHWSRRDLPCPRLLF